MSSPYIEGETLEVTVDSVPHGHPLAHGQLRLHILSVFQPITMSPVMVVRFQSEVGNEMEAILKLYDRRFGMNSRRWRHEWTREAEASWQRYVGEGKACALFYGFEEKERKESEGFFEDSSSDSDDQLGEGCAARPPVAIPQRLAPAEGSLQRLALQQFVSETTAYQKMTALQGHCVPSLLAHVSMSLAPPGLDCLDHDHEGYFKIPGILLQYIEGYNLSTELASETPREVWEKTVQRAVDAVKMMNSCGVINRDCQPRNVVVQRTTLQPFLIDFGQCNFREDYGSDDEFAYWVNSTDSQGAIGVVMAQKLKKSQGVKLSIRYEVMESNFDPDI